MDIRFEKANIAHIDAIFEWLEEPHFKKFWDNSQDHRDDILNFIHARKQQYFYGTTQYFVGSIDDEPYCFILSDIIQEYQNLPDLYKKNTSKEAHTVALDFGIGSTKHLGIGLAVPTLNAFIKYYRESIDPLANTFFIDPNENNPRAKHVYDKAGFKEVGHYDVQAGAFMGSVSYLMVRKEG